MEPGYLDALARLVPELSVLIVFAVFAWTMVRAWTARDAQWQVMLSDQRKEDREAGKSNAQVQSAALSELAAALRASGEMHASALREATSGTRDHVARVVDDHDKSASRRAERIQDKLGELGADVSQLAEVMLRGPKK